MADLKSLRSWIERDLNRFGGVDKNVYPSSGGVGNGENWEQFELFTKTNKYTIRAVCRDNGQNYLGCVASSRMPRAGETWCRGNDLYDGDLSEQTWQRIIFDIVCYELVEKVAPKEPVALVQSDS